jgi:hypothetical protein
MAALVVVLCGVLALEWPGLLIVILLVAVPLLGWMVVRSRKRTSEEREAEADSPWASSGAAILVITLLGLASFVAFFAACVFLHKGEKW